MKAIKITTDNEISVVDIQEPTLEGMQEHVGGYIQTARGYTLNDLDVPGKHNLLMIVNEDGFNMDLDYNDVATDLADDFILGDVLIMQEGFVNGDPDIVGLSDEQVKDILAIFENYYDMEVKNETN